MTAQQFTQWATAVFGAYLPAMKMEVEKWLEPHDEFFISALRELALREHPSVYGKPPGVHEIEAWKIEAYERGHTLQAITASRTNTTLIASDVEEEYLTPEEAEKLIRELREKLKEKA